MSRHVVIGTAGHIDHGKTALVRALTGTDTDRLAEEKRRGITIDLGFAHMVLPGDIDASLVDVPGHEDFIRNMVAGASGIDIALLVVAADEGVMPQTREHLAILRMLAVRRAVVALTKSDLVDAEWLELAAADLRAHVSGTPFEHAVPIPVSARTGSGLDALRDALAAAALEAAAVDDATGLFRMPVDRAFTIHGTGTVVTGTVREGVAAVGSELRVQPDGRVARVRALEQHGAPAERVGPGMRAALALTGIEREAAGRGSWIVSADWPLTSMVTARIELVEGAGRDLRQRQRVRVHIGTAEVMARVVLLDVPLLSPGESAFAQLRLESPVIARYGDRFVVRSYSPMTTIGGGLVLEPEPPKRRRLDDGEASLLRTLAARAPDALAAVVRAAGADGVPVARLPVRLGVPAAAPDHADVVASGDRLYARSLLEEAGEALLGALDAWHAAHPLRPGMDRGEARRHSGLPDAGLADGVLERLAGAGRIRLADGLVARADFVPRPDAGQADARARLLAVYAAAGLAPPRTDELPEDLKARPDLRDLQALLEREEVLRPFPPDRLVHAEALAAGGARLFEALGGREALGPADFREVFDLPRRHLIPLLELFDRLGWTRRQGDLRAVAQKGAEIGLPFR